MLKNAIIFYEGLVSKCGQIPTKEQIKEYTLSLNWPKGRLIGIVPFLKRAETLHKVKQKSVLDNQKIECIERN